MHKFTWKDPRFQIGVTLGGFSLAVIIFCTYALVNLPEKKDLKFINATIGKETSFHSAGRSSYGKIGLITNEKYITANVTLDSREDADSLRSLRIKDKIEALVETKIFSEQEKIFIWQISKDKDVLITYESNLERREHSFHFGLFLFFPIFASGALLIYQSLFNPLEEEISSSDL